jgi:hypothetical protein
LTFLARTHADFRSSYAAAAIRPLGRIRSTQTTLGSHDSRLATAEGAYLRMISIDEAYCDALSIEVLRGAFPAPDRRLQELIAEHELRACSSWRNRADAFATYHGVKLSQFPDWAKLKAGVEIRNAIAHGLGGLTVRQRDEAAKHRRTFAQNQVVLVGFRLEVRPDAVKECLRYSAAFIRWLDGQVS